MSWDWTESNQVRCKSSAHLIKATGFTGYHSVPSSELVERGEGEDRWLYTPSWPACWEQAGHRYSLHLEANSNGLEVAVGAAWGTVTARKAAMLAGVAIPTGGAGAVSARTRLVSRRAAAGAVTVAAGISVIFAETEVTVKSVVGEVDLICARRAPMPTPAYTIEGAMRRWPVHAANRAASARRLGTAPDGARAGAVGSGWRRWQRGGWRRRHNPERGAVLCV